ncbi:MAG: hypothetical protein GX442_20205 [Candidatus Riflebacteria bacterium]|nr:hypothetical protein [Candidatus Riflebacteria bacterium]
MGSRRIAIPVFQDRVSPLADGARVLAVWNCHGRRLTTRGSLAIPLDEPGPAARRLVENGIDLLVCGAISRVLGEALELAGIQVRSGLSGPVDAVIAAVVQHPGSPPDLSLPCWHGWHSRPATGATDTLPVEPHRPPPGKGSPGPP